MWSIFFLSGFRLERQNYKANVDLFPSIQIFKADFEANRGSKRRRITTMYHSSGNSIQLRQIFRPVLMTADQERSGKAEIVIRKAFPGVMLRPAATSASVKRAIRISPAVVRSRS